MRWPELCCGNIPFKNSLRACACDGCNYSGQKLVDMMNRYLAGRARANVEVDVVDDYEDRDPITLEPLGEHTFAFGKGRIVPGIMIQL